MFKSDEAWWRLDRIEKHPLSVLARTVVEVDDEALLAGLDFEAGSRDIPCFGTCDRVPSLLWNRQRLRVAPRRVVSPV